MVTAPPAMPVTVPVVEPTVAIVALLLLHVPPVFGSLKVVVRPTQVLAVPVIAEGTGVTVITLVVMQPVLSV